MKFLIIVAALLSHSVSQAAEYKVFDVTTKFALPHMTSQTFGINADLGRSWIEIEIHRGYYDQGDDMNDYYRVKVPGLSYDAATETINIESEGQLIECARFVQRGRSVFRRKVLELNDRCRFEHRTPTVTKDDGFEITKDKRLQVFLIVE